jgi:hypothetical protein
MIVNINVPDDLYRELVGIAKVHNISVEELLLSTLAEHVRSLDTLKQRAARGSREHFVAVLDKVPDVEPEEWDRR